MPKLSEVELKKRYKEVLEYVWETWENYVGKGNPFVDMRAIQESDIETQPLVDFYGSLSYLEGIRQTTGWPLGKWAAGEKMPEDWDPRQ